MRAIRSFALAITIASAGACAEEASLPGQQLAEAGTALPVLQLDTLVKTGRPHNFYRLIRDERPDVCAALDQAFGKPHMVATGRGKHPGRDLLLGNEYSIEWDELKDDLGVPASRADVDLNNDGRLDTVYRLASVRGGPSLYGLVVTTGHPATEEVLSGDRRKEIVGRPVQESKWGGISENTVFFTGPRSMDSSLEPIETIHPTLPADVTLPPGFILDIVLVEDRYYVVLGPAYYFKESPIRVFVFETRTPRDHSLVCYFESNYSLKKP